MTNGIECLITDMLSQGHTLSYIVCEIARTYTIDEVYHAGAMRFVVDAEGDIVCIGSTFLDCVVIPKKHVCLEEIHEKFLVYFNRAVYADLSKV